MFRKTSKLLVCTVALLLPLIVGIVVVMAKPAQQTTYPYAFSGAVIDDERGRQVPAMDIQITCGAFSTTIKCGQDGEWSAVFNLSTVTATCDIELFLLPNYQAVRAEASQHIDPPGIVVSPTLVHHSNIPFVSDPNYPYHSNNFYIVKPTSVIQTPHFSIEWYTDKKDPDYPDDKRGTDDAAYINVIVNALEDAWSVYETLTYTMPPPTYGRTDQRITVHVEQGQGNGRFSLPSRVPELEFPRGVDGLSFGGQFWIHNSLSSPYLDYVCAHELFHLVQYNYLGYTLNTDFDGWVLHNLERLALRDIWLIESGGSWAPGHVSAIYKQEGQNADILDVYKTLEYPISYGNLGGDGREYGAVIFPLFLEKGKQLGNLQPDIVRKMYEYVALDPDDPFAQLDNLLTSDYTITLILH